MRPRRVPNSNIVWRLQGGTEDNDLHARQTLAYIESVWELTDDERAEIASGATIELRVYSRTTPPVSLAVGPSIAERKA